MTSAFPLYFTSDPVPVRQMSAAESVTTPPSLFARVHGSIGVLYREVLKFGAVGAIAFVVDFGVFNLLRHDIIVDLGHKPLTAKTISVFVATIVAWVGNRYWTFRRHRRVSRRREFALFALMNIGGLGIALACLGFSHYALGLTSALADNIAGNVVGLGLGTLFRFWAYRKLVFTAGGDLTAPEAPDEHTAAENALAAGAGSAEAILLDLRTHSKPYPTGEIPVPVPDDGSPQRGEA